MRARILLLAGVAALIPAAIGITQAAASVRPGAATFSPPAAPMIMTRTLVRTMADGKQVIVTRRFAIRFTPEGDGYRLDGEQIGAEVAAPPSLASLAEIERKRVERGLFPARLDANGMMRQIGSAQDPAANRAAIAQGNLIISAAAIPLDAKRDRSVVLGEVASSGAATAWPVFLFNPGPRDRVERRKLTLASGAEGEVEVRVSVQGLMSCGLPLAIERTVTTRLAGTTRVSREVWTFAVDPARLGA